MKNMKMKTKLILGYFIPIALTLFNIIIGNMSTQTAIHLTEPARACVRACVRVCV